MRHAPRGFTMGAAHPRLLLRLPEHDVESVPDGVSLLLDETHELLQGPPHVGVRLIDDLIASDGQLVDIREIGVGDDIGVLRMDLSLANSFGEPAEYGPLLG